MLLAHSNEGLLGVVQEIVANLVGKYVLLQEMPHQELVIQHQKMALNATMEKFKHLKVELDYAKALGDMTQIRELALELREMHNKST